MLGLHDPKDRGNRTRRIRKEKEEQTMPSSRERPSSTATSPPPLGQFGPADGLHGRRGAAQRAVLGRHAPARQPVSRASGRDRSARARLRGGAPRRRPYARSAGQLRPRAGRSAEGRRDRSDAPAVRHRRPARRAWSRHRRLQGRQRDRRRIQGRASLLFRRLPAGSDARPDHRGHRARRSGLSREGHRAASRRPTASPAWSAIARPDGR